MMTKEDFLEKYPNLVKNIIKKYNYGALDNTMLYEAGNEGINLAFEKIDWEKITSENKLVSYVFQWIKVKILLAIKNKQKADRQNFIDTFIEETYDKISKVVSLTKNEYIDYSIELYNIGITIRNILEKYDIKYQQPELYAYANPFRVSFIIDIPLAIMDVSYEIENDEVLYKVIVEDPKTNVRRKFTTKILKHLKNYIIGYLSASTQIYEIIKKTSQSSQTEDNGSGESE